MKRHANSMTRNALNQRAISTANWPHSASEDLSAIANEQGVTWRREEDDHRTITLTQGQLRSITGWMEHHRDELRRFIWFDKTGR